MKPNKICVMLACGTCTWFAPNAPGQNYEQPAYEPAPVVREAEQPSKVQPMSLEFLPPLPGLQTLGSWSPLGPAPTLGAQVSIPPDNRVCGAIHSVAADPTSADILYIAAIGGGIWRTRNATAANPTWTPLTDNFTSLSMAAIEFDPTDATRQTLIAGSGRTSSFAARGGARIGVLYSTDGGDTWTCLGSTLFANEDLTSVAARGNILMAASDATWGGGNGRGLFRSTNTGASFPRVSGAAGTGLPFGSVSDLVGDPGNLNRFYAAVVGVGIFRSDDTGATWNNVTAGITGIGGTTTKIEMAVHNSGAGNAVYVAVVNNNALAGVFRSTDQGANWTAMDVPAAHPGASPQGNIHFSIAADPTSATIVYIGGDAITVSPFTGNLFRGDASLALGSQFTTIMDGNAFGTTPHADSREMVFDANGNLIEVDDGGIYRRILPRSNLGIWGSVVGNLAVIEAHDIAYDSVANVAMAGVQDNGTHIQSAAGSSVWTWILGGDGGDVAIDDTSLPGFSIRYGSSQNFGSFFRNVYDAANNFIIGASPALTVLAGGPAIQGQFVTPLELNKVNPARLAIGGGNSVYESLDLGNTVTALSVGSGVNRMALAYGGWLAGVANPDVLYFGSGAAVMLRTNAGGTVAASATAFPGGTVVDIVLDINDWRRAFATDGSSVFVTPDAGATWANITGNLPAVGSLRCLEFFRFACVDCVALGTDSGVYVCANNDVGNWSKMGSGLPSTPAFDLSYNPVDDVLVVGTLGRGVWRFDVPTTGPRITIPGDVFFADTCIGTTNIGVLNVCNTCEENLIVYSITSSNPRFRVVPPSSGFPVTISPDFCFPFRAQFAPTSVGDQSTEFTVASNDPFSPTNIVLGFGKGVKPNVTVFMANAGNFGDVCVGSFRDLDLTVNNAGGCPLVITDIDSSSSQFVIPTVVNLPLVVHPGDSVAIPIRFQPTSLGAKAGTIVLESNDPSAPNRFFSVSGQAPPGDVRVTGSTDFGEVCAGVLAEKTISVCNVGKCNLSVISVAFNPACKDFTLINNPFPAIVSPDSCMDVVIRYTPTSCGEHTCNLVIQTDDPDTPIINLTVTASTPCASIDVPPDLAFPPTVISSFGPCRSLLPFPISNTGTCPLWITDIQIGGPQAAEYSLVGLPSFPIILEQGHIVGEGDLSIAFSPAVLARERHATITVTYIIDPVAGTIASVTRELCGEGVHTGARVLVMQGNIPVPKVEKIQLQRINANRNKDPLDTHDVIQNALLVTIVPGLPCEPFQYHREYGTVSNPIQLLPGSYQVTVSTIINGKRKSKSVGFDVETCTFNPTVVIKY